MDGQKERKQKTKVHERKKEDKSQMDRVQGEKKTENAGHKWTES